MVVYYEDFGTLGINKPKNLKKVSNGTLKSSAF